LNQVILLNLLAHKYYNLAQLAAVNPGWSDKLTEIQRLRDDANDCKVDQFIPDSQIFFTNNCFVQGGASASSSSVSILPTNIELKPNNATVTKLIVELKNNTKKDITYDLSLGNLPNEVSASLNQQSVTVKAGETLDANSTNPVIISLQHSIDSIKTFPVSIIVSPQGEPTNAIHGVSNMLRKLLTIHKTAYFTVVFDAPGKTFRNNLYDQYKANRPPMPDDLRVQIEPLHNL